MSIDRHGTGQEVSEFLRERLQAVGAELVDAKARVSELESMQVADRTSLRQSADCLATTSRGSSGLTGFHD